MNDLLNDLDNNRLQRIPSCKRDEIPLSEIVKKRDTMEMIKATAIIFPYVDVDKDGNYVLRYETNINRVNGR